MFTPTRTLTAVLADITRVSVDSIYCLGDTLGYGPNPRECLDIASQFGCVLRGDLEDLIDPVTSHDDGTGTNRTRRMVQWTQAELFAPGTGQIDADRRLQFLATLKPRHKREMYCTCMGPLLIRCTAMSFLKTPTTNESWCRFSRFLNTSVSMAILIFPECSCVAPLHTQSSSAFPRTRAA